MIIIKKYGIELRQLTYNDIELVRNARNRDDIRKRMFDQKLISKEQQKEWFNSINNFNNFYTVITFKEKKIGLIYGKNIDFEKKEEEGGIFIWDNSYLGTGIAAKASIILMQFSFDMIGMDNVFAKVREDNIESKNFNLALGYIDTKNNNYMVLTRQNYELKINKLIKYASTKSSSGKLNISDIEITNIPAEKEKYKDLPNSFYNRFLSHYEPD